MDQKFIPVVSFPVSIVFVDDDETYLKRIAYMLAQSHYFRLYSEPLKALKFLKDEYRPNPFTNHCVVQPEDQSSDKRNIIIDIRAIHWEIYNKNRFGEVGILLIDHSMPKLTGGDLAKQLKGQPYKIILLTGEADAQTAVNLFNEGVIHAYVRKDNPDIKNLLQTTINNLQQEYFQELSAIVIRSLEQYKDYPHKWFSDPDYINLINQLIAKHNLLEFYLLDEFGSCLFLDENGKPSVLAITTAEMMETYRDFAENDEAPNSVVEGIKSRTMMPFFFKDEDFNVRPAMWGPYMHSATRLQGLEDYYYSYIANPKIDLKNVYSYADFLKDHG